CSPALHGHLPWQRRGGIMPDPNRTPSPFGVRPHAYDPAANPELFEDVLARRLVAFAIDLVIVSVPVAVAAVFIFAAGVITLGLGFFLFLLLKPAAILLALSYYGFTLGSPRSATIRIRGMGIAIRTWDGSPAPFLLCA